MYEEKHEEEEGRKKETDRCGENDNTEGKSKQMIRNKSKQQRDYHKLSKCLTTDDTSSAPT